MPRRSKTGHQALPVAPKHQLVLTLGLVTGLLRSRCMESLWKDIRFGIRILWKSPEFTFVALFALVLGIGANTAIFSAVNAVFLKPLPFHDPDRLVMVWEQSPRTSNANVANPQNLADWMKRNHSFEKMAGYIETDVNLTGEGGPERVLGSLVTRDFFPVLGVSPVIWRNFIPAEDVSSRYDPILLSYGLWQPRYGRVRT